MRPFSTRSNATVATIRIATVGTFATWWPLAIRARDCADQADQLGTHLHHWPTVVFRRTAGADIDFATARAERMNSSASGLEVRRLTVMILTEARKPGTFAGSTF